VCGCCNPNDARGRGVLRHGCRELRRPSQRRQLLNLHAKQEQALSRRERRRISGAAQWAPQVSVTSGFDAYSIEVRVPRDAELIWVLLAQRAGRETPALHFKKIGRGAEGVLTVKVPHQAQSFMELPIIRAFSYCGDHGSWASEDLEVFGLQGGHLILRERMAPEIVGDVDYSGMHCSPRDLDMDA